MRTYPSCVAGCLLMHLCHTGQPAAVPRSARRHPQLSWVPPITGNTTTPVSARLDALHTSQFTGPGQAAPEEMLRQFQPA